MNLQQQKTNMTFTYQGFTHSGDKRCFTFQNVKAQNDPMSIFSIEVDLPLLSRIRFPVQDAPMFCLQLLNTASLAGTDSLERLHRYGLVEEDFRSVLVEREKRAAKRAMRKPPRRPLRKPSSFSNVVLGSVFQEG